MSELQPGRSPNGCRVWEAREATAVKDMNAGVESMPVGSEVREAHDESCSAYKGRPDLCDCGVRLRQGTDHEPGSEARECEAYANPLDGGWGGYRAECHACKWIANRRDDKSVAHADALHRANQTCPWRQGTGHERVISATDLRVFITGRRDSNETGPWSSGTEIDRADGYADALNDIEGWLDERTAPSGASE